MKKHNLEDYEDKFTKSIGYVDEENVGYIYNASVGTQLPHLSYFDYTTFTTSKGKIISDPNLNELMEYFQKTVGYTDIRLWPNRISAYAGSARATQFSALSSISISVESIYFGVTPARKSYTLLKEYYKAYQNSNFEDFVEPKRKFAGMGRPNNTKTDERVTAFKDKIKNYPKNNLKHTYFLFELEAYIQNVLKKDLHINYASIAAALLLDAGFSMEEYESFLTLTFIHTAIPPYFYVKKNMPAGTFLPFRSKDIIYEGKYKLGRSW